MKKIAFFDIDGTMVNVPGGLMHPTEETKRVIKTFKEQGNYVVVATARGAAPESVRGIDFDGYICYDGHFIEFQNEILLNDKFTKEDIAKQIEIYKACNGNVMTGNAKGAWVSDYECQYLKLHSRLFNGTEDLSSASLIEDSLDELDVTAMTAVFGSAEDLHAAKALLPKNWEVNAYDHEESIRMDVYPEGFSKGRACEFLYKHLNIAKEDSYAFGDGINDIEMLQLVGNGIAMGNAAKHIQEVAKYITDTVDNDGIAKAFKKHLAI